MKNNLEQLLDSLIEKGWKPFWYNTIDNILIEWDNYKFISRGCYSFITNIRLLVSKESWLWQFVCENGMIRNEKLTHNWVSQVEWGLDVDCKRKTTPKDYEYRLIEASLKDESELEDFLLSNIKLD